MDSRRGLEMWGPVGRWVFLNWPRGSWQYDLICGAIIVGLFVLPNPQPQSADLDAVLAGIEAASEALESFTADMSMTEHIVLFDDKETESGTVSVLQPSFYRRDIKEPNERIEMITDDAYTMYMPRIKQAQIGPISDAIRDDLDLEIPGLSSADLREAFDVALQGSETDESDGATLYVVHLVPKQGRAVARSYKSITLTVAEGEWYPARRIVLENYTGDTTTVLLTNVDRDADLDEDDFRIEFPRDTEIVRHGATDTP